jgi:predicted transcriptional regulator
MEIIWTAAEAVQVGDVHDALPSEERGAYNTVKTTMERLAEKGILSRVKQGKAYLYRAALSREELERRIITNALDRLVEEFPEAVASFFVRPEAQLSEERLALLQDAVERRQESRDA